MSYWTRSTAGSSAPVAPAVGTEAAILEAATRCVRRYGVRRTTLEEVARRAGVSRATLYRYFVDKEDLVTAVLTRADAEFVTECTAVMDAQRTLLDQIVALALQIRTYRHSALLELGDTEPQTVALMLTSGAAPLLARWIDVLAPYVETAKARGEIRPDLDTRRTCEWTMRALLSLVTTPGVAVDRDDPDDLRRFLAEHYLGLT